ncbi:MAG: response regulator [Candidatus Omnitrophica bacterium]|nr:response regulator [Candidatus Omnitrophota bacterium]
MIKVLIVDDEDSVRNSLRNALKDEGYEVTEAASGAEALERIKKDKPHIILLDLAMPAMSGTEVLRKVRETGARIIIITMGDVHDAQAVKELLSLGAIDYLLKPVDAELLKRNLLSYAAEIWVSQLHGVNILVADYDAGLFVKIKEVFDKRGLSVLWVDKTDALSLSSGKRPDLIIVIADSLGKNTGEFLSQCRRSYPNASVLIGVNPFSTQASINEFGRQGSCLYLKPAVDISGLVTILYTMIVGKAKQTAKYPLKEPISGDKLTDCIVVADDDPTVCSVIHTYLAREGYKVEQVTDAKLVIGKLKRLRPFLLFLDIVMPGVDGLDVLREAKRVLPEIDVVILSGLKDDAVCEEAAELGASVFITKPFSLEQIKATVLTSLVKSTPRRHAPENQDNS